MTWSRAAVFTGRRGELEFRSFPTPVPVNTQVLVRIAGSTLCGSDLHTIHGRREVPVPTILGHEIVGRIESFGPHASRRDLTGSTLEIGDLVCWSIVANCGECYFCLHDLPQKCERMTKYGHEVLRPGYELTGGLAEHCLLVEGTAIVKLPGDLSISEACPASCATATIAAAVEAAGSVRDSSIVVSGAGMLGLTACAMCRANGAKYVVATEPHESRRRQAISFGATHATAPDQLASTLSGLTNGRGADIVLECSGSPDAVENVWPMIRLGGRLVLVGSVFPSRPIPWLLEQTVRRNLSIAGIHNYAPRHLATACQFLRERLFPMGSLVQSWVPLDEVARAIEIASEPSVLRVGVLVG